MKMAYDAKILYKMKEGHPDWNCEGSPRYDADYIDSSIRHDLKLVAGGGYNAAYIEVVDVQIRRVA